MTLLLAIRSRVGVVLASDGQATGDASGHPTRAPIRKLRAIGGRVAWGASGSVGLAQTLEAELRVRSDEVLRAADPRPLLAGATIAVQQRALAQHVALEDASPPELACLFCWCDLETGHPRILSVPRTGAEHQLHARHAAVGSGEVFAEAAMAGLGHVDVATLGVHHLEILAYRALADAIRVAAVHLGAPIQLFAVTAGEGAVERTELELERSIAPATRAWNAAQAASLRAMAPPPPPSLIGIMRGLRETA